MSESNPSESSSSTAGYDLPDFIGQASVKLTKEDMSAFPVQYERLIQTNPFAKKVNPSDSALAKTLNSLLNEVPAGIKGSFSLGSTPIEVNSTLLCMVDYLNTAGSLSENEMLVEMERLKIEIKSARDNLQMSTSEIDILESEQKIMDLQSEQDSLTESSPIKDAILLAQALKYTAYPGFYLDRDLSEGEVKGLVHNLISTCSYDLPKAEVVSLMSSNGGMTDSAHVLNNISLIKEMLRTTYFRKGTLSGISSNLRSVITSRNDEKSSLFNEVEAMNAIVAAGLHPLVLWEKFDRRFSSAAKRIFERWSELNNTVQVFDLIGIIPSIDSVRPYETSSANKKSTFGDQDISVEYLISMIRYLPMISDQESKAIENELSRKVYRSSVKVTDSED